MRITLTLPDGERCELQKFADQILEDVAAGSRGAATVAQLASQELDGVAEPTREQREAVELLRAVYGQPGAARELLAAAGVDVQDRARLLLVHTLYRYCPGTVVEMEPETNAERSFLASVHSGPRARH